VHIDNPTHVGVLVAMFCATVVRRGVCGLAELRAEALSADGFQDAQAARPAHPIASMTGSPVAFATELLQPGNQCAACVRQPGRSSQRCGSAAGAGFAVERLSSERVDMVP
jgi:hypothetical protein